MFGFLKSERQVCRRSFHIIAKAFILRKAHLFDAKFYSKLTKKIGDRTVGEILNKDQTNGNCYFYAALLASTSPKLKLVHGILHSLDVVNYTYTPFTHAWVESDKFVYDTSSKTIIDKKYFYKKFRVEAYQNTSNMDTNQIAASAIEGVEDRAQLIPILQQMDEFKSASPEFVENVTKNFMNKRTARRVMDAKIGLK